ncbi:hypothetical protein A9Q96_04280 [Rhodobacterales bacterium 52_120_T64]|nr:hypothetical protein A9Q96_04280 [Rhodobacterales bacterium 52_120_T64]
MQKGELACDPRGLIYEAYRIEGIEEVSCRPIFLDWALGVPTDEDPVAHIKTMLAHYGPNRPDHPMTNLLRAGLDKMSTPRRRKRR